MLIKKVLLGATFAALVACLLGTPGRADDGSAADAEMVRKAGEEKTDAASLAAYLRKSVLTDKDREHIEALVRQLGHEKRDQREEATEKLAALGAPAVSFLQEAARSPNREVSYQASVALALIGQPRNTTPLSAAVRLLARKPDGDTVAALLDFFPYAGEDSLEDEVLTALGTTGVRDGKPVQALLDALKSPLPARRAAAVFVIARLAHPEHRHLVRHLLADPDARVRWFAGRGLLGNSFPNPEAPLNLEDRQLLKGAGVSPDAAGLLAFVRKRTLSDEDRKNLEALVKQLDHNDFPKREGASQRLVEIGTPSLPFLRTALAGASLEKTKRIERCIEQIEKGPGPNLPMAAARMLAQRHPPEAVEVLLNYVPFADDSGVEEEVITALGILSLQEPRLPPALTAALKDELATRRGTAALVLGQVGDKEQLDALRPLLKDADARVRYRAAQATLAARDKEAVPVLVALLADAPMPLATQAETILQSLGGEKAPTLALAEGGDEGRKKCHAAWETWWRDHGDKLVLASPEQGRPHLGLTIVAELGGGVSNHVWEFGLDRKERWDIPNLNNPIDARVVRGDNVLIAEHAARRVFERDKAGKIVWEYGINGNPVSCQRLPNGNTFIAHYQGVLEVTPAKKEVYAHNNINGVRGFIWDAHKMPNGNIVIFTGGSQLIEIQPNGKQVRSLNLGQNVGWGGVEGLPGNHFLVALPNPGKLQELDGNGKVVWECNVPSASHATKLPNGNIMVACMNVMKVVEVTRGGKIVWEKTTKGRPFHVHQR